MIAFLWVSVWSARSWPALNLQLLSSILKKKIVVLTLSTPRNRECPEVFEINYDRLPGIFYFAPAGFQLSLSSTVRLKTRRPGPLSLSGTKYPFLINWNRSPGAAAPREGSA